MKHLLHFNRPQGKAATAGKPTGQLAVSQRNFRNGLWFWLLIGLLLSPGLLQAQIYDGDVTLTSQEQVNEFGSHRYKEVKGNLIIQNPMSSYPTDISDLTPLDSLTKVHGSLNIQFCPMLKNLAGLRNLDSVGVF